MRKTIVGLVAVALASATGGVLYTDAAFAATETCPPSIINRTVNANVTVPSGSLCLIAFNSTVNGNINVSPGGGLEIFDSTVNGNINSSGAGSLATTLCGLTTVSVNLVGDQLNGNVTVDGSAGNVVIGGSGGCARGNTIIGVLTVDANHASVLVQANAVGNNAYITNNTPGPVTVVNNAVTGNLACSGNAGFTQSGNTAKNKSGQCA